MTSRIGFWEDSDQVRRFAAREPDLRLQNLAAQYPEPARVRVLDIGCAGGRNTVFLAEHGFDVWAVDSSNAMVEETRSRLERVLGEREARRRVQLGSMDRLDWAETASFDLIVALGIYHCAQSRTQWREALSESARVLKASSRWLVSVFTPETDLTGRGIRRVPGEEPVYEGLPGGGRAYLIDAASLDVEIARWGFAPLTPTETVRRDGEVGRRVSANGLYVRKPPGHC